MVIQLADREGIQIKQLDNLTIDAELNDSERDFQITIPIADYDSQIGYGSRIFVTGTEIGGILGELMSDTSNDTVSWIGYTWRGMMAKKIIQPPEGEDYLIVNGELNNVLKNLIEPFFDGVFVVPEIDTGITVSNYKFMRYCTLLDGLVNMLRTVNYRLEIKYCQGEPNGSGYVEVQAMPIIDWSNEIELSQDSRLNFRMKDKRNGVNHLIILGKGELRDRTVVHLYLQEDGSIGDVPFYTGINEIEDIYENSSCADEELEESGREKFKELISTTVLEMDIESLGINVAIGDVVGGRDHVTGMYMAKPVSNIIVKVENDKVTREYKLEGN